jgi:hypothetical protein
VICIPGCGADHIKMTQIPWLEQINFFPHTILQDPLPPSTTIVMVEIHIKVSGIYIPFIAIPSDDIQRLSTRPFRWIKYIMFSICGARGHLSVTPDGPPVDYEALVTANNTYYYESSGKLKSFLLYNVRSLLTHPFRRMYLRGLRRPE